MIFMKVLSEDSTFFFVSGVYLPYTPVAFLPIIKKILAIKLIFVIIKCIIHFYALFGR